MQSNSQSLIRTLASAVIGLSATALLLLVWNLGFQRTDWAVLALLPIAVFIFYGAWPLIAEPYAAQLGVALRRDSSIGKYLKGYFRAALISGLLAIGAVSMLAWQALDPTPIHALLMGLAFLLSCFVLGVIERSFLAHFHPPFARSFAAFWATWIAAFVFWLIFAFETWTWQPMGQILATATINQAINVRLGDLPDRDGWVTNMVSVFYSYEALKAWLVFQMPQYRWVGVLFSLDSALFSFVLCRSAIAIANFCTIHVQPTTHHHE